MEIFPSKEKQFRLVGDQSETIDRLKRRTDLSKSLTSANTDRSFRGMIEESEFKIISSAIGKGPFCVMSGQIDPDGGIVFVEIHKVFKVLLTIILLLPVVAILVIAILKPDAFSLQAIMVAIFQMLLIRFFFIGFAFWYLSKESLERLRDVLDVEWVER